jgi:hypothetical protein
MKPLDAFSKRKASKDGKQLQCKQCEARYHKDNKEARNAKDKAYNKENKEAIKARKGKYYKDNRGEYIARNAKRRACKVQATPKWANLSKIEGLYKLAQYLTKKHGRQIHVDHIVPLQNPLVCGLHVEDNLQLLFADENLSKSNSFKVG